MRVILSLGTNLGDRWKNISSIIMQIRKVITPPVAVSSLMETEPVGVEETQPWYYNIIVAGQYDGSAHELLAQGKKIEKNLGRNQKGNRAPRCADIDILLADDCVIHDEELIIPHPQLLHRRFCIEGVAAIEPYYIHPVVRKNFRELMLQMNDDVKNQKIHFIPYSSEAFFKLF